MKCTHRTGCDANATYRTFLLLASGGSDPLIHRVEFPHEWRCAHHRSDNPEEFLRAKRSGADVDYWPHLARRFEAGALRVRGPGISPVRERTKVLHVEDGYDVEEIPIVIVRDDGVAENAGRAAVRRARV